MQNIQQKLKPTENGWEMQVQFTTEKPLNEVWSLISTTEGYSQWFPEIQVDPTEPNKMAFVMAEEDFNEDIPVINSVPHQHIQYEWSGAVVSFSVHELADNATKLIFCEDMPNTFPHPAQDMAGWVVQMIRLSELCEGNVMPESEQLVKEWLPMIEQEMAVEPIK